MHLRTVHARELPVPAADAGALLDALGLPGDRLWPNAARGGARLGGRRLPRPRGLR
jgi:hypothetical protein